MHKILVVDDDIQILELIVKMLNTRSYKSAVATTGRKALDLIPEYQPDLIILDWNMPEMDGIETLKQLKADELYKEIPVIMLTAQTTTSHAVNGLNAGAVDYVRKPIDTPEFLSRIDSAIRQLELYRQIRELEIRELERQKEFERVRKEELRRQVDAMNQELYLTGIHLTQKTDLMHHILDQLRDFDDGRSAQSLSEIIDQIEVNSLLEEDLANYRERVTNHHHVLSSALQTNYPELTETELKVCAMAFIGLSNKETAGLLYISERTAESHRYRISKKLNLKSGKALRPFLIRFASENDIT